MARYPIHDGQRGQLTLEWLIWDSPLLSTRGTHPRMLAADELEQIRANILNVEAGDLGLRLVGQGGLKVRVGAHREALFDVAE